MEEEWEEEKMASSCVLLRALVGFLGKSNCFDL